MADVLPGSIWITSTISCSTLPPGPATASASRPATYRLHGPDGTAYGLTFEPDGNPRRDGRERTDVVKVWNVLTGKMTHLFRGHEGWASGVAFSPDGNRLASAGQDGMIRIWDVGPAAGTGSGSSLEDPRPVTTGRSSASRSAPTVRSSPRPVRTRPSASGSSAGAGATDDLGPERA